MKFGTWVAFCLHYCSRKIFLFSRSCTGFRKNRIYSSLSGHNGRMDGFAYCHSAGNLIFPISVVLRQGTSIHPCEIWHAIKNTPHRDPSAVRNWLKHRSCVYMLLLFIWRRNGFVWACSAKTNWLNQAALRRLYVKSFREICAKSFISANYYMLS